MESKGKEGPGRDSFLRAADRIEIRKLYPRKESPPPLPIEEKSMEVSRDSYWPNTTPLPPMLVPSAILRISPIRRSEDKRRPAAVKPRVAAGSGPGVSRTAPLMPYWMREGSPDELVIQGVQLVEPRFNEFDYL